MKDKIGGYLKRRMYLYGILLVTFALYLPSLFNSFLSLDDPAQVTNNPYLKDMSLEKLSALFSNFYDGLYHPLTTISFFIDYHLAGMEPFIFHLSNLFLHLLNTALVYFILRWLVRVEKIAVVATLLFGIHPMHVESVAWISERKDLLYSFFYLASVLSYIRFVVVRKSYYYILSISFFLLSLMSKGMAVSLPLTLMLIDFFRNRVVFSKQVLKEKIPFFILALFFGIVSIIAKYGTVPPDVTNVYSFFEFIVLGIYSLGMYFAKLVVPRDLSPFYPFPEKLNGILALKYYVLPVIIMLLLMVLIYKQRRKKHITFGFLLFLANILLVIQWIPNSNAIISDRNIYIASIGIFYLIGLLYYNFSEFFRSMGLLIFGAYFIWIGYLTFQQQYTWKDDLALSERIIEIFPETGQGYALRGNYYYEQGNNERAHKDYNKAIKHSTYCNTDVYVHRASILVENEQYVEAMEDLDHVIKHDMCHVQALYSRAQLLSQRGKLRKAILDYSQLCTLEPDWAEVWYLRALLLYDIGKTDEALCDIQMALKLDANFHEAKLLKEKCLHRNGEKEDDISELNILQREQHKNKETLQTAGQELLETCNEDH